MARYYRLAVLSLLALFCSTTPLAAQPPSREQPRFGGVLKVAMNSEPPSLDPHWTTTVATWGPMWHVFETLYTIDKDWSPTPHLAEGHTVTDGWRQYTITLRKGVRFRNGKEMNIDCIQLLFYEDVGRIKFGDLFGLNVTRKELRGDFRSFPYFSFWNAWLERK